MQHVPNSETRLITRSFMFYVLLTVAVIGVLFFRSNTKRGQTFVRATEYLMHLNCGCSADEANLFAAHLFTKHSNPDYDQKALTRAANLSRSEFNGKQLPIIQLAQEKGFSL